MSQQSRVTDEPLIILTLLIVSVCLVGWGLWYSYSEEFLAVLRFVRLFELTLINIVALGDYTSLIKALLPTWLGGPEDPKLAEFTTEKFLLTTDIVGAYFRWPVAALVSAAGFSMLFFSNHNRFKRKYDLEGLIGTQAKIWPILNPIVKFDPGQFSARSTGAEIPAQLPLFAEALSPEEWLAYHDIKLADGLPEREAVRRALIGQLGARWAGPQALPPHLRALYAAFALKGIQKRTESDDLLSEIAVCWSAKTGFHMPLKLAKKIDEIIGDPEVGGKALQIASKHAYTTTALLGVLRWGRTMGGVLAPATFLWLRGMDRNLWYPLNNLGRRSFHSEAAGAMAHFMAEQAAKKPLPIPRIDTALITINQYLANNQVEIPPKAAKGRMQKA
ncbi:MAG: hypothetical protein WDO70_00585 [Alphaproteobacteria bacterium]